MISAISGGYRLTKIEPGFITEELGTAYFHHNNIKLSMSIDKMELRKTRDILEKFILKLSQMCEKNKNSDLCRNPQKSEIESTQQLVDLLAGNENEKQKRDTGDAILGLFGWRRINEWDEYNLKVIQENEQTLKAEIEQQSKYLMELKNYVIEEKRHNQKKMDLLETAIEKALNETNQKANEAIIELNMMEIMWIMENQVLDIQRQLKQIGHSIDRTLKLSASEFFEIVKDKKIISKINEKCGKNKRISLNRATIFTKNSGDFLDVTLTIPVFEDNKLQLYKITAVPKIIESNNIQIPIMEADLIAMSKNSHQYVELKDTRHACVMEENNYFCKINRMKTFNEESSCVAKALFSKKKKIDCKMQHVTLESGYYYHKLTAGGDYLYVMTKRRQSMIECEGSRRVEILEGTGIVSIDKQCRIMDNYDTLYPTIDDNMNLIGFIKHENWSTYSNESRLLLKGITVVQKHEKITELPQLIHPLKFELRNLKFVHVTGLSVTTLLMISIFAYCTIHTEPRKKIRASIGNVEEV